MDDVTKLKLKKTAKGALIAGGGVALTYFLQSAGSFNFGNYSTVVAAICAVLINAVKESTKKYEE